MRKVESWEFFLAAGTMQPSIAPGLNGGNAPILLKNSPLVS
jgi:hypothetical protein